MVAAVTSRPSPWRLVAWVGFVLAFAALSYASRHGLLGEGDVPEDAAYRYTTAIGAAIQYAITFGILLLIARGLPLREAFALTRPRSWRRAAVLIATGYVGILTVGGILGLFLDATEEQGLIPDDWDASRAGAFAAFFLVVTLVGPTVEELTFRGLGFTLLSPFGTVTAVVVTATLFGVAHGLLVALPVLTAFGLLLGTLRTLTGSVYPPIVLHAFFNGVALIVSVTLLD